MVRQLCVWSLIALLAVPVWAISQTPGTIKKSESAVRVPVVVELFTSEGCSSCPPADRLLAALIEQQPVEGALVIGLSEHVDYWDRQGWKDPFSNPLFTRRQEVYAARFGTDRIYTPQMVVDGQAEFVGSDRDEAVVRLRSAATRSKVPVSLAWPTSDRWTIRVQVPPGEVAGSDVWLALVEDGLSSTVTRGENQGRTLAHAAVARRLTKLGEVAKDGSFSAEPVVDIDGAWNRSAVSVVVFLQSRRSGYILGAAILRR